MWVRLLSGDREWDHLVVGKAVLQLVGARRRPGRCAPRPSPSARRRRGSRRARPAASRARTAPRRGERLGAVGLVELVLQRRFEELGRVAREGCAEQCGASRGEGRIDVRDGVGEAAARRRGLDPCAGTRAIGAAGVVSQPGRCACPRSGRRRRREPRRGCRHALRARRRAPAPRRAMRSGPRRSAPRRARGDDRGARAEPARLRDVVAEPEAPAIGRKEPLERPEREVLAVDGRRRRGELELVPEVERAPAQSKPGPRFAVVAGARTRRLTVH